MSHIQVIPLFTKEDDESFKYFRDHLAELDFLTGTDLTIILPETVQEGDSEDVYRAAGSKRYSGLRRDDFPCLWIEDSNSHFIVKLPGTKTELVRLLRALADEAGTSQSAIELKGKIMNKINKATSSLSRSNPWISGSFYLVAFLVIIAFLLVVGKILPAVMLPIIIIGGILAVSVVGALQLKNDERLKDESFLKLMALTFRSLPLLRKKTEFTEGGKGEKNR